MGVCVCVNLVVRMYVLGLSQICSNFCPKYFQDFLKIFTYYALQVFPLCLPYAPRSATFFLQNIVINECSNRVRISLQSFCSIREY